MLLVELVQTALTLFNDDEDEDMSPPKTSAPMGTAEPIRTPMNQGIQALAISAAATVASTGIPFPPRDLALQKGPRFAQQFECLRRAAIGRIGRDFRFPGSRGLEKAAERDTRRIRPRLCVAKPDSAQNFGRFCQTNSYQLTNVSAHFHPRHSNRRSTHQDQQLSSRARATDRAHYTTRNISTTSSERNRGSLLTAASNEIATSGHRKVYSVRGNRRFTQIQARHEMGRPVVGPKRRSLCLDTGRNERGYSRKAKPSTTRTISITASTECDSRLTTTRSEIARSGHNRQGNHSPNLAAYPPRNEQRCRHRQQLTQQSPSASTHDAHQHDQPKFA
ncbi:hypothetical protein D9611_011385 [Ephemerocybe angulata]|uniref:Uncharacterized protein n=1 Tax=Ephemerocybe angulata TaxID=980116 RepID=A0A8H5BBE3_9AGAR|nr:hypothetical protein D9611_011385 [Tulosesus angulatus]